MAMLFITRRSTAWQDEAEVLIALAKLLVRSAKYLLLELNARHHWVQLTI